SRPWHLCKGVILAKGTPDCKCVSGARLVRVWCASAARAAGLPLPAALGGRAVLGRTASGPYVIPGRRRPGSVPGVRHVCRDSAPGTGRASAPAAVRLVALLFRPVQRGRPVHPRPVRTADGARLVLPGVLRAGAGFRGGAVAAAIAGGAGRAV